MYKCKLKFCEKIITLAVTDALISSNSFHSILSHLEKNAG